MVDDTHTHWAGQTDCCAAVIKKNISFLRCDALLVTERAYVMSAAALLYWCTENKVDREFEEVA